MNHSKGIFFEILSKYTVREVAPERKDGTICLNTTDTLQTAVQTLGNNKILSAPLLNEKKECVGFVEMIDILHFVVEIAPDILDMIPGTSADTLKQAIIGEVVLKQAHRQPFVTVQYTTSAAALLEIFAKGVHRVAVYDDEHLVVGTCSQSDLVRFLQSKILSSTEAQGEKAPLFAEISARPLKELGFKSGAVVSVTLQTNVILALKTLIRHKVEALAVTEDAGGGKLVANFSASDLRGLYQEHFPHFLHSVRDFLKQHSPHSLSVKTGKPESTLLEAVDMFVTHRLHRIWIVNSDGKPGGVITLTDFFKVVLHH